MFGIFNKKSAAQKEWKENTILYASAINEFVETGMRDGWDNVGKEPEDKGREHLVGPLLDAIRSANKSGDLSALRDKWPLAHAPLVSLLDEKGQSIPTLAILDDGRVMARVGTEFQEGYVLEIDGVNTKRVDNLDLFGISPCEKFYAYTTSQGIKITKGWLGEQTALCDYPTGTENIPSGFTVKPFENTPSPSQLIPFPDGKRVLFVSSEGIFVLEESKAIRLLPTIDDLKDHFEWSQKEYPKDGLSIDLSMQHGAVSADGKFIAIGSQDSTHLVFNQEYKQIADIGNMSEYPHYALFDTNSNHLILNSCHFYNGATIGVSTSILDGLNTEAYEANSKTPIVESGARVYAAAHRNDEFIIGDASGYLRAFDINGNPRWQHFIGSSVGDIAISKDGSTMACSTYAGFISIFKMDHGQSEAYEIGNSRHTEIRRWLVWQNEDGPLAW